MNIGCKAIPDSAMQSILASSQASPHVAIAEAACSYGSCRLRSDSAALLTATPPILKLASSSKLLMPVAQFSASPVVNLAATSAEDAAAGAVHRRILFQVFEFKHLSAISAQVTALDLTALEACFATQPELFRRFP